MKRSILLTCILFLTIITQATHVAYVDLTYKCLGGNLYQFTLTQYVECGTFVPQSVFLNSCSPSNCFPPTAFDVTLALDTNSGQLIYPTCAYYNTVCLSGPDIGFRKWIYKGTRTLSAACPDYVFRYAHCCRPSSITNIVNPLTTTLGIEVRVNLLNFPGDNSPIFNDEPPTFMCCNQLHSYDQGATDADGDSLVYSLYNPFNDFTNCTTFTNITYQNSFSYTNPFTSSPQVSMNSSTGSLTANPTNCSEQSVIGIKVDEYRNGNWVGSITRDTWVIITGQSVGIKNEKDLDDLLSTFPDPFNAEFYFSFVSAKEQMLKIQLMDVMGRIVYSSALCAKTGENKFELNGFQNLSSGIYILSVSYANKIFTRKVVKE